MSHNRIIIKSSDLTTSRQTNNIPGDEIVTSSGLFLADDSADPTSSVLGAQADLSDGDVQTVTSGVLTGSYSVGLDLATAKKVLKLIIYDVIDSTRAGIWFGGINDTLAVYTSADNSTWVLLQTFKPMDRLVHLDSTDYPSPPPSPLPSPLPFDPVTADVYKIELILEVPPTTRYIKAYASKGAIGDSENNEIQITEIEAITQQDPSLDTLIFNNIFSVSSIVSDAPLTAPGDGTGSGEPIIA